MSTDTPVIEARDISKVYEGTPPVIALQPTSLQIFPGNQVAIVGASGSGKSTLLSVLSTLDDPTSGSVSVNGRDFTGMKEAERSAIRANQISIVFQQFHLIPTISATENVAAGLLYTGTPPGPRTERAVAALENVGLGHRLNNRPGELSGGEQQRVAIARALVRNPSVLFADEPTGALDSVNGEAIVSLLLEIAESGTAVVMVTHDADLAGRFPYRIRLRDGRIVDEPVAAGSDMTGATS